MRTASSSALMWIWRTGKYTLNMQLRDNQVEPIDKAIQFFRSDKVQPSIIVLPTAWGKSILSAYIAKYCGDNIIILQPSKELLEQNYKKYNDLCDGLSVDAGVFSASFGRKDLKRITYATIGSIVKYGKKFRSFGFNKMLIDEAHLYPRSADSMIGKFLRESGITHVLGITATPLKLQSYGFGRERYSKLVMLTSKSRKGNFYKDIIHVGQVSDMVDKHYWSDLKYKQFRFDGSALKYNSTKSDYTEGSIKRAYVANNLKQKVIDTLNGTKRRHTLVFVPSVDEAIALSKIYPASGVVYGDMDKNERAKTIDLFKRGVLNVLFNVRVLTTGFDFPGIDCIVIGISTASIALYYQIIGRGTRLAENKRDCLVVDLGGNFEKFGMIEDITFERGKIWRMFGTGGRLLSGIPVHEIGRYTKQDAVLVDTQQADAVMPFGKYKGERIIDVPKAYKDWMLRTFEWNAQNEHLRKLIISTMG